jgi:hypothetical protein
MLVFHVKKLLSPQELWLTLVMLATWEAEIRKIKVRGQPGQIVLETPISKITRAKMDWRYSWLKW